MKRIGCIQWPKVGLIIMAVPLLAIAQECPGDPPPDIPTPTPEPATPTPVPETPTPAPYGYLYSECTGTTFFPSDACVDGACAAEGLATTVYKEWKRQMLETHHLAEEMFAERIAVSNVSLTEGPSYVFWRVDYVFVVDWVRSRQSESVNLGDYPLDTPPTPDEIVHAVSSAIEKAEQFDLQGVVSVEAVVASMDSCLPGLDIDWCHIDFENVSGILDVEGSVVVDWNANQCKEGTVDVANGALRYCVDGPCVDGPCGVSKPSP